MAKRYCPECGTELEESEAIMCKACLGPSSDPNPDYEEDYYQSWLSKERKRQQEAK